MLAVLQHRTVEELLDPTEPLQSEINVYGGQYTAQELHNVFVDNSELYPVMAAMKPRFSKSYGWRSDRKFAEKLGDDVVLERHGLYQALAVGIPMIKAQRELGTETTHHLTPTDEHVLVAHDIQHDYGEAVFGDIPWPKKTPEHEKAEHKELLKILIDLFGEEKAKYHIQWLKTFDNPLARKQDTFKRRFWNANERVGYVASALTAWDIAQNLDSSAITDHDRRQAQLMAIEVPDRHVGTLEQRRGIIPYVDDFLKQTQAQRKEIDRAAGRM